MTRMRQSDASVICCVTYFHFSIQYAFLYYIARQVAPALQCTNGFNTLYQILDVAKNMGSYLSCTERIVQGTDFELILMVKI